jgi:capsular exopolysaccharide synthesis family protein
VGPDGGLPDLFEALRWRWKTLLAVPLVVFAIGVVYVESLAPRYDGKSVVAISPRSPAVGADSVRVLAPKYVAYVAAPTTADAVARKVGETSSTLQTAVNSEVAPDTGNLTITVRLRSARTAARAANAYAASVVNFAKKDPLLGAEVVAPAVAPTTPASPPRRLLEIAALAIGILLGVGVSALFERGRPRLRSWRDMSRLSGYPIVGRIPRSRRLRAKIEDAFVDPATAAAFRTLRASIEPQLKADAIDVVLVTSPGKGDGKTTVAALLAESLARLGQRVLLVDADTKRPRLARMARLNGNAGGLTDVLRNTKRLDEAVVSGWVPELALLPTEPDPEASDLLSRRFAAILSEARQSYDVIVVDSPPLLGTDEARALAQFAGGIVLVVSAGTMASPVNEAVLVLEGLKAPVLGIVGNRLKEGRSLYY